jgi:CPA1 family monovalent cation:H+ antiporter
MVVDVAVVVLVLASLLVVVSFVQPLAVKLRLPHSVLLAVVGVAIGFGFHWLKTSGFGPLAGVSAVPPVRSTTFLNVFLPALLFQAALTIEVRRMMEDAAAVLLLAVVAVVVATGVIGFGLKLFTPIRIEACLLLGAIVATTDPAAVVGIFRDLGAPARLTRLVEGESLFNDAAAITLFTFLLGILVSGTTPETVDALWVFALSFLGGAALGLVAGRLAVMLLPLLRDLPSAEVTLTLALPYLVYVSGEAVHLSGVVAVVAAGLTVSGTARPRLSPGSWTHLQAVWEQIAYWAGSLVFILASLLIPALLAQATLADLGLVAVVVVTALAARAAVLFGLFPLLSAAGLTQAISRPFQLVITWGGLRGAVTLALALAVTEHRSLPPQIKHMVAVLATGFVLFTLLVNGTTLRPLIRLLGLDRLSPMQQALRRQVMALSLADVRDSLRAEGQRHGLSEVVLEAVTAPYDSRIVQAVQDSQDLTDRERFTAGLIALADRERELMLEFADQGSVSPDVAERLLRHAGRLADAARSGGRLDYSQVARRQCTYSRGFRWAFFLHRRFRIERPLARRLADRFEAMLVTRLILAELRRFAGARLASLFGTRVAAVLDELLHNRADAVHKSLDALRLQYPDYAEALEKRFLRQSALRSELTHWRALHKEGVIGEQLFETLRRETRAAARAAAIRPKLDLRLSFDDLARRLDLFQGLDKRQRRALRRLVKPCLVLPGTQIVRRGGTAERIYFISSGAVEVVAPRGRVRLGRGEFFGEIALLTGGVRSADITALTYCHLLTIDRADFGKFLTRFPELRETIEATARQRMVQDQAALPAIAGGENHENERIIASMDSAAP